MIDRDWTADEHEGRRGPGCRRADLPRAVRAIVVVLGAQLRDAGAAEECAQEAFLEMVRPLDQAAALQRSDRVALAGRVAQGVEVAEAQRAFDYRHACSGVPPELEILIDLHDAVRGLPNASGK